MEEKIFHPTKSTAKKGKKTSMTVEIEVDNINSKRI